MQRTVVRLALVLVSDIESHALEVDVLQDRLTVSVEEAGEMLGISRGYAYELVRRGELPSVRLGRRIVVPVHQLWAKLNGGVIFHRPSVICNTLRSDPNARCALSAPHGNFTDT